MERLPAKAREPRMEIVAHVLLRLTTATSAAWTDMGRQQSALNARTPNCCTTVNASPRTVVPSSVASKRAKESLGAAAAYLPRLLLELVLVAKRQKAKNAGVAAKSRTAINAHYRGVVCPTSACSARMAKLCSTENVYLQRAALAGSLDPADLTASASSIHIGHLH